MEEDRPDLQVRLLGPPVVVQRGQAVSIPRRKAQALLYYLISDQRAHARDKLATLLWEECDDARARRNLSNAIATLRGVLGASPQGRDYILTEGDTLCFNTAVDYRLDVAVFEHLVAAALKETREQGLLLPATCARLEEGVALYHGDFLEGFVLPECLAFQDWVSHEHQRLQTLLVEACETLGHYYEGRGAYRQAAACVARLVQIDDWNEDFHRWLMGLYSLDGDRAAALRQYRACQQALARDNMPISPETEALFQRIQQGQETPRQRERYELRAELGKGRMGVVYRAWDAILEREVALKVLSEAGLDKKALARFRRESRVLARLKHPNVVTLYEITQRQGVPCIVMELVEGKNLHQASPPDIPHAVEITVQMCAALEHAHQQGVVHRDIRPENVLITHSGLVKVLDFGLARVLGQSSITSSGELVGSPLYMSPEQARGGAVDHRADLYSLGVVLYELVTGRLPFQGDGWAVVRAHMDDLPPPPRLVNPAVPLALEHVILKLLAKSPEARFPSAAAVQEALEELLRRGLPSPTVAVPAEVTSSRLVGREEEWGRLEHHWQQALEGKSPLVFLCGEAGIGKTRLAREFISRVQKHPGGAVVLRGSCREQPIEVPYAPWAEALRGYLRTLPREEVVEIAGAEAAELMRLVPELREWLPVPPGPLPPLGFQAERLRLFGHVAGFLLRLSRRTPVCLFLDDLHWADAASLQLLEHVFARTEEEGRILFLGAYRSGEVGPEHPLPEVQQRMWQAHRTFTLELARLNLAGVKGLAEALLGGQQVSPDLAGALHRETAGNPFFVEEMVKALWEEEGIRLTAEGWERPRSGVLTVPGTIQAVLNRRLDRLSETCRHALVQASAMGQEFDFDVLKALVSLDDERLLNLLDEALEAGLVDEVRLGQGEMYRFRHALIARALYERMSSRRRALLHRRIGRIMESVYAGDLPAHAEQLAYHFSQGVRGEEAREEALRYSLLAAERAAAVYANQEAVRHYRRALSVLRGPGQEPRRLEVLERLADVYATLEIREAVPLYEEGLALWQEIKGDKIAGARLYRKLAELTAFWAGTLGLPYDWDRTQALVKAGLELLGNESRCVERVRLLIAWGTNAYRYRLGQDYETARQRAQEAVALAQQLGVTDEWVAALSLLGEIYLWQGELRQARDVFCSHLEEVERKADLQRRAEFHRQLGRALWFMGEYAQAVKYLGLAGDEFGRMGHIRLLSACLISITWVYVQWDRWPEAFQSGAKTIELRRKHGLGPWFAPLLLAWVHAAWGDAEGVQKRRLEALEERDDVDTRMLSYLSAQISMAEGDFATGRRVLEEGMAIAAPSIAADHFFHPCLAECAARTGDGEAALRYAALAEEVARRGGSKWWLAPALRARGLVYTEQGGYEQAEAHLREALAMFQGMGCRWEEGRTRVDLARLYRRRGEGSDRERAWEHYQEALSRFEELWARPDIERVQQEMLGL